jgi:hypothetical protein
MSPGVFPDATRERLENSVMRVSKSARSIHSTGGVPIVSVVAVTPRA